MQQRGHTCAPCFAPYQQLIALEDVPIRRLAEGFRRRDESEERISHDSGDQQQLALAGAVARAIIGTAIGKIGGAAHFFGMYRSVMLPSAISAAKNTVSESVGCAWMVSPM